MGSVDRMIEGRFLIRMKKGSLGWGGVCRGDGGGWGGGYKRRPCLLSSLMAAAMGLRLIKSLPLAEAEFKKCCQVNTQRRTSEALHGGQNNSQMQSLHIKAMECIHIAADCKSR